MGFPSAFDLLPVVSPWPFLLSRSGASLSLDSSSPSILFAISLWDLIDSNLSSYHTDTTSHQLVLLFEISLLRVLNWISLRISASLVHLAMVSDEEDDKKTAKGEKGDGDKTTKGKKLVVVKKHRRS